MSKSLSRNSLTVTKMLVCGALLCAVCLSPRLQAQSAAHEHGVAEVGIAVDGKTVQIEFTAPGSAIMGFEHEAKSDADKKKMADAFAKFKSNAAAMFLFDPALGCKVSPVSVGLGGDHDHDHGDATHTHGTGDDHGHGHADVRALVDATCSKSAEGSTLRFQVSKFFPEAATLRIQVVGNAFQTGAELKGSKNTIKLGR